MLRRALWPWLLSQAPLQGGRRQIRLGGAESHLDGPHDREEVLPVRLTARVRRLSQWLRGVGVHHLHLPVRLERLGHRHMVAARPFHPGDQALELAGPVLSLQALHEGLECGPGVLHHGRIQEHVTQEIRQHHRKAPFRGVDRQDTEAPSPHPGDLLRERPGGLSQPYRPPGASMPSPSCRDQASLQWKETDTTTSTMEAWSLSSCNRSKIISCQKGRTGYHTSEGSCPRPEPQPRTREGRGGVGNLWRSPTELHTSLDAIPHAVTLTPRLPSGTIPRPQAVPSRAAVCDRSSPSPP